MPVSLFCYNLEILDWFMYFSGEPLRDCELIYAGPFVVDYEDRFDTFGKYYRNRANRGTSPLRTSLQIEIDFYNGLIERYQYLIGEDFLPSDLFMVFPDFISFDISASDISLPRLERDGDGVLFLYRDLHATNLKDRLNTGVVFPKEKLLSFALNIGIALDAIHAQNYVHMDVEDYNILIDDEGEFWLIDFNRVDLASGKDLRNLVYNERKSFCYILREVLSKTYIDDNLKDQISNIIGNFLYIQQLDELSQDRNLFSEHSSLAELAYLVFEAVSEYEHQPIQLTNKVAYAMEIMSLIREYNRNGPGRGI